MPTVEELLAENRDLHEEIEEKKDRLKRPNLTLATNHELLDELKSRVVMYGIGDWRPISQAALTDIGPGNPFGVEVVDPEQIELEELKDADE